MALVWRAYVAGESTKDRREIVLKKLSRTFADIIRNSNGPDSIWAKSRIRSSREPSRFALISKGKTLAATARLVHARLKKLYGNNWLQQTDGAAFILPS